MYSKIIGFCCTNDFGDMNYARDLFVKILEPSVYLWNIMIKGYSRINCPEDAASLYVEMLRKDVKPDTYTFPFLLKGFDEGIPFECGKGIHAHICKFGFDLNEYVQHSLIHMYCVYGQVDMARRAFDMNAKTDVAMWNLMVSGYNRRKQFEKSMKLFNVMEEKEIFPNSVSLVSVLSACSELKDLDAGKRIHQYVKDGKVKSNLILNNALINMYANCGEMEASLGVFSSMQDRDVISWTTIIKGCVNSGQVDQARRYFDQMPHRDSVSWTALLDGYLKVNRFKDVLLLFREMQTANVRPDAFTTVSILTACAHLGALELGEWLRVYIDKYNIKDDICVGNALIDMYLKCGEVDKALRKFANMPRRDKFTWTAVIVGLAANGHGKKALNMFSEMLDAQETPDEVTYVGVLSACTHAGMVNEGRNYFASMATHHEIEPNIVHYGCLVDLLGRSGNLKEAYNVIKNMPMKPNTIVWGTLLGACRLHKDVEMAETAAAQLLLLEPENEAVYVHLCNIYATCKKWESLQALRKIVMERGIKKTPGCSLMEVNGVVHEFVAGDHTHPQSEEMFLQLEEMNEILKLAGYVPDNLELMLGIG